MAKDTRFRDKKERKISSIFPTGGRFRKRILKYVKEMVKVEAL